MAVPRISRESLVPNFRKTKGIKNVFRSSAPDNLVHLLGSTALLSDAERFILYDATLLIDLRSPTEIDAEKSVKLLEGAPGGKFEEVVGLGAFINSNARRQVLRLHDCAPTKNYFIDYVTENWIPPDDLERVGKEGRNQLVYQYVNGRGLEGLVEVILETKVFIESVLKAITIHLENRPEGKVVLHCNAGKDRAGVISMLCQSMLGMADEDIVDDFALSSCIKELAEKRYNEIFKGKVDSVTFAAATPQTMRLTLTYLRQKYGSLNRYMDDVGFDASWRSRFVAVASQH